MKKLLLLRFSLFLAVALSVFACSKEDDVAPEDTNPQDAIAFDAENPPVQLPTAILSSTSVEASIINGFVNQITPITSIASYFQVPAGTEFSTTPIVTGNGRSAAMADVKVYSWSAQGTTIAYQYSETSTDLKFEIFIDINGAGFYKFLEGNESKAATRNGNLKWFLDGQSAEPYYVYSWEDRADGSFNMTFESSFISLTFDVAADGSGVVEQLNEGVPYVRYTWNAAGTGGTVTEFDSNGNVVSTFDWTA